MLCISSTFPSNHLSMYLLQFNKVWMGGRQAGKLEPPHHLIITHQASWSKRSNIRIYILLLGSSWVDYYVYNYTTLKSGPVQVLEFRQILTSTVSTIEFYKWRSCWYLLSFDLVWFLISVVQNIAEYPSNFGGRHRRLRLCQKMIIKIPTKFFHQIIPFRSVIFIFMRQMCSKSQTFICNFKKQNPEWWTKPR